MMLGLDAFGARLEHASCSFGATTGQPIHSHSQITSFKRRGSSRNWRVLTLPNPPSQGEAGSSARACWPYRSCAVSEHGACTMLTQCPSGVGIKLALGGHRLSLARAWVSIPCFRRFGPVGAFAKQTPCRRSMIKPWGGNAKANGKVTVGHENANGVSVSTVRREVRHAGT